MNLVFNELSIRDIPKNKERGAQNFEGFIKTYSKAIQDEVGMSRDIITSVDLNTIELAENYYVAEWRNQQGVDKDVQRIFKRMCDRQRYEDDIDAESELSCDEGIGTGLFIAYQDDTFLISVKNNPYWNQYIIECNFYELESDTSSKVFIRNISSVDSITENLSDIVERTKSELNECVSVEDLLLCVEKHYPSLMFHKTALKQIENQLERKHIPVVCRKLYDLEKYFSTWDGGVFDESRFPNRNVSVESKETLRQFKEAHEYVFDDGKVVLVSYHMRYTGNVPGRIYFYPDSELKKGRICSLTTKLPTVKNPKERV